MSNTTPKISVIVPMYNVEKYLSLCISSILNQTFKDFELILIDDCSTDNTLKVAESFSDSRIRILRNEKNSGAPGAVRNIGIDAAQGEYIVFCDSDDAILPEELEVFFNTAEKNNADIVNTTKWYTSKNPNFQNLKNLSVQLSSMAPILPVSSDLKTRIAQEFLQNRIHISPVIFLYRREILLNNKIKFPSELKIAEDVAFNFEVVCATDKIVKIDKPFYIRRVRSDSISHSTGKIQSNIQCLMNLHKHIEEKLLPLNDFEFTQKVLNYWTNHVTGTYILPFVRNGNFETVLEMSKALQPIFEKNSSFVLTLLQAYSQARLFNVKNKKQILKLATENKKLKTALENIQKQIEEVTKT